MVEQLIAFYTGDGWFYAIPFFGVPIFELLAYHLFLKALVAKQAKTPQAAQMVALAVHMGAALLVLIGVLMGLGVLDMAPQAAAAM